MQSRGLTLAEYPNHLFLSYIDRMLVFFLLVSISREEKGIHGKGSGGSDASLGDVREQVI